MLRSIHVRFVLVNVLVVIVSIVLTTLLASRMTADEYRRYTESGDVGRQGRLVTFLTDYYTRTGSWAGAQDALGQLSTVVGERIAVVDTNNTIVADSGNESIGKVIPTDRMPPFGGIFVNGTRVGAVIVNPSNNPRPPRESIFPLTINRMIMLSASVAGFIAILVTLILSRRVLDPVNALTSAARRMGDGDLSVRVTVKSKDEVGQLGQAFNKMADGLSRTEQLRRNMVNDVAHELRTPLTNLRGYLEAAREGVIEPDNQWVESLYEETMLLTHLTNDLQDLAMAEARQLRLVLSPVDVGELVRSTLESTRMQAEQHGLHLRADVALELPLVDADPTRIGQVLRNLVNNALDFTPRGGEVSISARAEGKSVRVEVRDSGPGIAAEHLPLVFERFYRVDPSRTRATGGAGLGLTIVKSLIDAHGGSVWAESKLGAGSTFCFTLPATPAVGA